MAQLNITIPDPIHADVLQAFRQQYNMPDPTETVTDPDTGEETQQPRDPTQAELSTFLETKIVDFIEGTYMAWKRDSAVQPVREQAEREAKEAFASARPQRG